jgi:hypothetical protein
MSDSLIAFQPAMEEHGAVVQEIVVDQAEIEGDVLQLASGVGEPKVDIADLLLLDLFEDLVSGHVCWVPGPDLKWPTRPFAWGQVAGSFRGESFPAFAVALVRTRPDRRCHDWRRNRQRRADVAEVSSCALE